ncbi:MAG: aldo/keto reductase [Bacteroidota bacterium]|nr:aldo/keto reductase [Bacteroidota bacterium]
MKKISRKEFITRAGAGIVGLGMLSGRPFKGKEEKPVLNELGNTGIFVTSLCFGASRTNDEGLIRFAIDHGINFLDTGRSYARGNNERLVGRAVKGRRKDIVIQSKMHLEPDELRYEGKGRKGHAEIKEILEKRIGESLEALDTDYIDIMLFHSADQEYLTYHEAVLEFYDKKKREGIIRAHGFSSHDYSLGLLKKNNSDKFYDIVMHAFNYKGGFTHSLSGWSARWDQDVLLEELEKAAGIGTGIVAMKTCSAGPYSFNGKDEPTYLQAVEWVLQHPFVHSAAVAMMNYEQARNYIG